MRPSERAGVAVGPALASAADRAACRAMIRTGSKSFFAASLLLPAGVRPPAYAFYAFCRLSDDAVDLDALRDETGGDRLRAVAILRRRLADAVAGRPADHAVDRAFADMLAERDVPPALIEALIEGLEWDALGRRFETLSDLRAYGARVAGAVGAVMTVIMGVRDASALARACDLGVAMQLTNIARDVGEDARAGRLYLPLDWLDAAGVEPRRFLAAPEATTAVRGVVRRLLDEADALYRRSEPGIAALPAGCRPAVWAARLLYDEIGREVARRGCDSVSSRAVVGKATKARLLGDAAWRAARAARDPLALAAPVLPETRFLVDVAARAEATVDATEAETGPLMRTLHLFQRITEADHSWSPPGRAVDRLAR